MGRVANLELASLWRKRVERQRRSGLSIVEYCRREKISAANFHAWKRRLRGTRPGGERKSTTRGQRRSTGGPSLQGGFVQFPLAVESAIEVRFADGTLVSLPSGNMAALAVTLRTLQSSQPEGDADKQTMNRTPACREESGGAASRFGDQLCLVVHGSGWHGAL